MIVAPPTRVRRPAAAAGLLWVAALSACYHAVPPLSTDDAPVTRGRSYGEEKVEVLIHMEDRMNAATRRYQDELVAIRDELIAELDALRPPSRLLAVERNFRGYGAAEEERFEAEIEALVEDAVARTERIIGRERTPTRERVVGQIEQDVWAAAAEVGGNAEGAGYGFVSGVREVDEMAEVTLELLKGFADVQGLRDLGEIRKGEVIELAQFFRHDLTVEDIEVQAPASRSSLVPSQEGQSDRVGRLILFQGEPLEGFRVQGQESLGAAVGFQNDRLPESHDLGFIQGMRSRIVRGGVVVSDFPWMLDPGTALRNGRLITRSDLVDRRFIATDPLFPGVNVDHERFDQLRDFTVIYDYKTGLVNHTTGEVLGSISWQLSWAISESGNVRLLPSVNPSFDGEVGIIRELMNESPMDAADAPRPGHASDLLGTRRVPPQLTPTTRRLMNGQDGPIVEYLGGDRIRVTHEGRRFVLAHRLQLLTSDSRLLSYRNGSQQGYVLGITFIDPDSALIDLGFRKGDDVLSINDAPIRDFQGLWTYVAEHPRESRYDVLINRGGARRRLEFIVDGAPPLSTPEEEFDENPTDEMMDRLQALFEAHAGEPSDDE